MLQPFQSAPIRAPGGVLLVSCYELGRQPLSLAVPLAVLQEAGFAPAACDLSVERLDPASVRRAALVAIAVPMHTALRIGVRALGRIRALNPDAHLCLYGLYASLNRDALLERGADSIIGGECEGPLRDLAAALETGGDWPDGVATRARPAAPRIAKAPGVAPSRAALPPLERYARLEIGGSTRLAGQVEASRGCLHLCRHCPIPPEYAGRFLIVPQATVLADLAAQAEAGARHISFADPDFLNGPRHALAILREAHARWPDMTFDFTARIEHLVKHADRLPGLGEMGCLFVVSAVESISDRVLGILDKGHTRADVERALGLVARAGLALRPTFVPFTPWSGLHEYADLLRFVAQHDLVDAVDPVQLAIRLLVPPGSLLLRREEMLAHLGPLDPERFTYRWSHPDPRVDRLQIEVAGIVARGASEGAPATAVFERVAARASAALEDAGESPVFVASPGARAKGRTPRLTEPWFC